MRLPSVFVTILFVVAAAGCRTVNYQPLASGTFVSDELNTEVELRGVELIVDLEGNRAVLRDGETEISFTLRRITNRAEWIGGCGTMTSYAVIEAARIEPTQFELRGQQFRYDYIRAHCYRPGVWLGSDSESGSVRWIFGPPQ